MTENAVETPDINTLFNRDPMSLSDDDISQIVEEYRKKRHAFNTNPTATKRAPPTKTVTQKAAAKLDLDIDLKL